MTDPFDDLLNNQGGQTATAEPPAQEAAPDNVVSLPVTSAPDIAPAEPAFGVGDPTQGDPAATEQPEPESPSEPGPVEPDVERPSPVVPEEAPPVAEPEPAAPAPAEDAQVAHAKAVTDRPSRSDSMKRRHREALDAIFGKPGVHFEVLKEVHLPEGQKFKTPFGNSGRNGWVIREVGTADAEGKGGTMYTIGASALKIGINEYKVIDPLPAKPRGRKPKTDEPAEGATATA